MTRKRIEHDIESLRERAVQLLNDSPERAPELEKYAQADNLIQDVRIYHAELEIQNEELRRAQVQLEMARDHLYHLYHQAPVGYITLAKTGLIHEANHTAAKLFRIDYAQLLNKPISDIFHPDDRPAFFGRFKALMHAPDGKSFEIRFMRSLDPDNCFVGLIEAKKTVLPTAQNTECILLNITDITDHKRAEEMLQLSNKIIETSHDAVLVTDAEARIISVNPSFCRSTGYSRKEVIGQNPSILQSGEQDKRFYQAMWDELKQKGCWQGVLKNRKKNGEIYSEKLTITAIRDDHGRTTHYVGIFSDITEQLSLEEQLLQSQKMEAIGTMVGGIAHDFNNILAGILGNAYLATRKIPADNEKLRGYLNTIEHLGKRASELIQNMLTFARKGIVKKQKVDLRHFLSDTVRVMGKATVPENIGLQLELPEEDICIHYDKIQLQQVFLNLLTNARDAVAEKPEGHILIRLQIERSFNNVLRHMGPVAILEISDNGCGIPQDNIERVFEPFFTTKAVGQGTGLGLSTIYGSVQSHGGHIHISSHEGSGTTVHIALPVCEDEQARTMPDADKETVVGAGTILFADDEEMLRSTTCEMLQSIGYQVIAASDGKQALEIFRQRHKEIDLVIADVVMPYLGGHQLADKLRKIDPLVPMIFLTGYDKAQVLKNGATLQYSEVLSKPFDFAELTLHISRLMKGERAS